LAERFYKRSLEILEATLKPGSADISSARNQLAWIFVKTGDEFFFEE
jgi:hypothetical protein